MSRPAVRTSGRRQLLAIVSLAVTLGLPAAAEANTFPSDMILNDDATLEAGDKILLTENLAFESGSAWLSQPLPTTQSLHAQFTFYLHDTTTSTRADGIMFVIQTEGTAALGEDGGYLGYGGTSFIAPSVGVEFDTFLNSWDSDNNHVGIDQAGNVSSTVVATPGFDLYGQPITAWVDYVASIDSLSVYAATSTTKPAQPLLTMTIDLASALNASTAFVGFTSATGGYNEIGELTAFSVNSLTLLGHESFISRFFPTRGRNVTGATAADVFYSLQWMIWDSPQRMTHIRTGFDSAYEHEAFFPPLASSPNQCWPGDYGDDWDSNLPSGYLDTPLDDHPADGFSRAGGSGQSTSLGPGNFYFHLIYLQKFCNDADGAPFKVRAQDSHRLPPNCSGFFELCVFPQPGSPRDIIPYAAGWLTRSAQDWRYNQLLNTGFELGFDSWTYTPGTATIMNGGAVDGSKWVALACGGVPPCQVKQQVARSVVPQDLYTFEISLRCNAASPCPVVLRLRTQGIGSSAVFSAPFLVPAGSVWNDYGYGVTGFSPGSSITYEVENTDPTKTMGVDFATLHWSDLE